MAGSVLARPAQGRFEGPLTGPARLLQRTRVRSARGRAGEQVGELPPARAAAATARGARQGAQEGAVALGQGQERAGMGRARVGVPPGERRLRAAHVERVGAAAVGAGGGVIAGKGGWGRGGRDGWSPARRVVR